MQWALPNLFLADGEEEMARKGADKEKAGEERAFLCCTEARFTVEHTREDCTVTLLRPVPIAGRTLACHDETEKWRGSAQRNKRAIQ